MKKEKNNRQKNENEIKNEIPDSAMELLISRETPESERDFLSEEELKAAAVDVPEELVESLYEDDTSAEKDSDPTEDISTDAMDEEQHSTTEKVVAGESIGIKEGERIGLGLRSMQTQAELEKKKKKKRRKLLIFLLVLILVICGAVGFYLKKQADAKADTVESSEDVVPAENQELIIGQITSIQGNEITYDLVEEDASENSTEERAGAASSASSENMQGGEMPDMSSDDTSDRSTGNMTSGDMPDMSSGAMPDMGGEEGTTDAAMPAPSMLVTKTYHSLGKEPCETMIPVGTDVVTKLGTTTSFARLATGDVVQMLMERDGDDKVIIKMWIVG
ncbi:MAG: hypothetical protein PHE02_05145 [Lachnospiraceae bacterium]|nr:hypothetical protein [Lachnospiraceae bacterium]